jgi:hypothetical protein
VNKRDLTWIEKFELASKHGGISLNETECYQLAIYLMTLIKKSAVKP